jgi:hypothetical protein
VSAGIKGHVPVMMFMSSMCGGTIVPLTTASRLIVILMLGRTLISTLAVVFPQLTDVRRTVKGLVILTGTEGIFAEKLKSLGSRGYHEQCSKYALN